VALDNAVSSSNITGVKSDQSALPQIDELVGDRKERKNKGGCFVYQWSG